MGEAHQDALRLDVDRRLKLECHGTKVASVMSSFEIEPLLLALSALWLAEAPVVKLDGKCRQMITQAKENAG